MDYPWFKFFGGDFLNDPKMLSLTASERSVWLTILCYASISKERGVVRFLDEEKIMSQSGMVKDSEEWKKTIGVLNRLETLEMIRNDNGSIFILNWEKRQAKALTPYERVKRYREKHKKITNDNDGDAKKITTEEDVEEEEDVDKYNRRAKRARVVKKTAKKPKAPEYNALGAEIIKALEEVDPKNKTHYANKTQRSAADFLLSEHGLDQVLKVIALLPKTNGMPYFPKITSAFELKENWVKLESALIRKKGEKITKGRGVEM